MFSDREEQLGFFLVKSLKGSGGDCLFARLVLQYSLCFEFRSVSPKYDSGLRNYDPYTTTGHGFGLANVH